MRTESLDLFGLSEEDVKLCNCAGCGRELLGESMGKLIKQCGLTYLPPVYRDYPVVSARVRVVVENVPHYRPYCYACMRKTGKGSK